MLVVLLTGSWELDRLSKVEIGITLLRVHITPMITLLARLHEPLSRGFRRGNKYQLGDLVSTIPPTQGSFYRECVV